MTEKESAHPLSPSADVVATPTTSSSDKVHREPTATTEEDTRGNLTGSARSSSVVHVSLARVYFRCYIDYKIS